MTDLFDYRPSFDGATFDRPRDNSRLHAQLDKVRSVMLRSGWLTLDEISNRCDGAPTASVSARLRDLRKVRFGSYDVQRRYRSRGLWEYKIATGGQ